MQDVSTTLRFLFSDSGERSPIEGVFTDEKLLHEAAKSIDSRADASATWEEVIVSEPGRVAGTVHAWLAAWPDSPAVASAHLSLRAAEAWISDYPRRSSGYTPEVLELVKFTVDTLDGGTRVDLGAT